MKKVLLATMLLVTLVAMPAFAAVQNIKVSGNIDSSFVYRDRFDLTEDSSTHRTEFEQRFLMTQTRLRVDADLSDNVAATVALINERAWGTENQVSNDTALDLYLSYVTLREMLYSPMTVTIGRQQFKYGNSFIIGAAGPNNSATGPLQNVAGDLTMRTSYDGAKFVFDYKPLTIDVFGAKVNANNLKGAGSGAAHNDDVDLYGINANYQLGDAMNTTLEGYLFTKIDNSVRTSVGAKADRVYTPGLRASTNPIKGWNVQGEVAMQRGSKAIGSGDNIQRDAMAAQVISNYLIPFEKVSKYKPSIQGVYTWVTGDTNPDNTTYSQQASSNKFTGWDPMFEDQSGGKIYNALFNLTNDHIVELSGQFSPIEDVMAKFSWTGMWLDKEFETASGGRKYGNGTFTGLVQPDSSTVSEKVTTNLDLGHELDADLTYDYTEDVQFGLSLGWFFPGNAFYSDFNQKTAKQAIAHVGVAF